MWSLSHGDQSTFKVDKEIKITVSNHTKFNLKLKVVNKS